LTNDSPPIGRLICLLEKDDTYHVEVLLRDQFFTATTDLGVRFTHDPGHLLADGTPDPKYWDVIDIPELSTDIIEDWAESEVGSHYDFFGAFNSAMGVPLRDPYRWFCSEIATQIASMAGEVGLDPLSCPSKLRQQLLTHTDRGIQPKGIPEGLSFEDQDSLYLKDLVDRNIIDPHLDEAIRKELG
jgi:hypothetical protein